MGVFVGVIDKVRLGAADGLMTVSAAVGELETMQSEFMRLVPAKV